MPCTASQATNTKSFQVIHFNVSGHFIHGTLDLEFDLIMKMHFIFTALLNKLCYQGLVILKENPRRANQTAKIWPA
jgi:hypothetical protein